MFFRGNPILGYAENNSKSYSHLFMIDLPAPYTLEKRIWSHVDFKEMGWHDSNIYRVALDNDLALDIDYILKWNQPNLEGMPFTFWIAPATLVFKNITDLKLDIDLGFYDSFEIDDIERGEFGTIFKWTIMTQKGEIHFASEGYEQFIRQDPFFEFGQTIPYIDRNGYSLERTTEQENPNRNRADIVESRNKQLAHYENAKKRHLKRGEKEALQKARENGQIDTKTYLVQKKEIVEMLDFYDHWLKGTRFEKW
jgi:hypothetical protein